MALEVSIEAIMNDRQMTIWRACPPCQALTGLQACHGREGAGLDDRPRGRAWKARGDLGWKVRAPRMGAKAGKRGVGGSQSVRRSSGPGDLNSQHCDKIRILRGLEKRQGRLSGLPCQYFMQGDTWNDL